MRTILLASGDSGDRAFVEQLLPSGVALIVAPDTETAARDFADNLVHGVIIHCNLPGSVTAPFVVRQIRAKSPSLPIVGLTTGSDAEDDMFHAGVNAVDQTYGGDRIREMLAAL